MWNYNPSKKLISIEGQHQKETSLQQNSIGEAKSLFYHKYNFLLILHHGIHRHNKHIEEKKQPKYCLRGIDRRWRTIIHVTIHKERGSQRLSGWITHILWICQEGIKTGKNCKTTHIWPKFNVCVGIRNTHFGWHDREWRQSIWWKTLKKSS